MTEVQSELSFNVPCDPKSSACKEVCVPSKQCFKAQLPIYYPGRTNKTSESQGIAWLSPSEISHNPIAWLATPFHHHPECNWAVLTISGSLQILCWDFSILILQHQLFFSTQNSWPGSLCLALIHTWPPLLETISHGSVRQCFLCSRHKFIARSVRALNIWPFYFFCI